MNLNIGLVRSSLLLLITCIGAGIHGAAELRAQASPPEVHCAAAERFLVEDRFMVAITDPDTIRDWRTRRDLPGCRITAAGTTTTELNFEAASFYEDLVRAGWSRTPDPRDTPNEASLRFRRGDSDCLFNFYSAGHLGTVADLEVSSAVVAGPGQARYNIFVMCTPAMDAAARAGAMM